jgi:transglutaminase-like putative cysteine protease
MNPKLTITAAVAVAAASLSLNSVIASNGWLFAGFGAIVCVALAGTLTRLSGIRSAISALVLILLASAPLFSGHYWWITAFVAVLFVASVLALWLSLWPLRWFATLAAYLAILLIYFNLVFASAESFGRVIPTSKSLTVLAALPGRAVTEFGYRPPIPDIAAVSFFAAAGIGLVAVLVDVLAVWLRRPAVAGLPLLALFSVPVASNLKGFGLGQSLTFAIGLAGFLMLLATDGRQRLRMWGRLVSFRYVQPADEAGPGPDTRDISASGRRIGLAAVCLAIVVPLVLPTMHVHDVFATSGGGGGTGSGEGGSGPLSPLLTVQKDLVGRPRPVLTYTTSAPKADTPEQYLQVYALTYDAASNDWVPITASAKPFSAPGRLPEPVPGLARGVRVSTVRTTISTDYGSSGRAVLPMPYAPVSIVTGGLGWEEQAQSLTVSSDLQAMSGLTYTVTTEEPDLTRAEETTTLAAPPSIVASYTAYTGPYARQLRQIADSIAGSAGTEFQKAVALQNWFRNASKGFQYSTKPGLPSSSKWIIDFLETDKRGDCQQYSWAFAVLARLLGIPTRIAVGYTAGSPAGDGRWKVTTADAHAWPEIYLPGVGWIRFEPTPGGSTGQGTATTPAYARSPGGSGGTPGGTTPTSPGVGPSKVGKTTQKGKCKTTSRGLTCPGGAAGNPTGNLGAAGGGGRHGPGFPWGIVVPAIIVALLALPGLGRIATRRRRWLAASGNAGLAHAAWREMADDLADYGLSRLPSESPRALVRRIAAEADLAARARGAAARIGGAEERARYALSAEPGTGLRADVRTVRRAVAAHSPWSRRLRARLFPASTLATALRGLQRATELFGWLDTSWPTMRQFRASVANRSRTAGG